MPVEPALRKLAADNDIIPAAADVDIKALLDNRQLWTVVLREVVAAGRKGGLAGIELICAVVLVHDEWTPQSVSILFFLFSFPFLLPPFPLLYVGGDGF
jgi:long-chain acyl-CoA synthetase